MGRITSWTTRCGSSCEVVCFTSGLGPVCVCEQANNRENKWVKQIGRNWSVCSTTTTDEVYHLGVCLAEWLIDRRFMPISIVVSMRDHQKTECWLRTAAAKSVRASHPCPQQANNQSTSSLLSLTVNLIVFYLFATCSRVTRHNRPDWCSDLRTHTNTKCQSLKNKHKSEERKKESDWERKLAF